MKPARKILVVEPSDIILEGLSAILGDVNLFTLLPPLHDCSNLSERIAVLQPDVIIVNPTIVCDKSLLAKGIAYVALVYQYVEPSVIRQYDGVIDIRENKSRIVSILREVLNTHVEAEPEPANYELSERETEILVEIANGLSSKEIANKLNISVHTVNTHRKNITHKTGIKSLAGLGVYAMLHDLMGS